MEQTAVLPQHLIYAVEIARVYIQHFKEATEKSTVSTFTLCGKKSIGPLYPASAEENSDNPQHSASGEQTADSHYNKVVSLNTSDQETQHITLRRHQRKHFLGNTA